MLLLLVLLAGLSFIGECVISLIFLVLMLLAWLSLGVDGIIGLTLDLLLVFFVGLSRLINVEVWFSKFGSSSWWDGFFDILQ